MVADILQDHVNPNGITEIHKSELFTKDNEVTQKDKEFIDSILSKKQNDITTKELNKLKEIVRLHMPSSLRVPLWMLLSGGSDELASTPKVYEDTCERLFSDGKFEPDDEYHEEQRMVTYYLTQNGIKNVQKVLIVIKDMHPDITYCPLLEPIVAVMLHFMGENQCYSCLCGILDKHTSFLEQTKFDNSCTDMALQELFKSVNRKGYSRLKSFVMTETDDDEESSTKNVLFPLWRNMIFERLDFVVLVRIVDCLLVEGAKILYRVAMYLLNIFHSYSLTFQKMQFSDAQDLITTIGQHAQSIDATSESFMKAVLKVKFTSKQLLKLNQDNIKLYKEQLLEYARSDAFNSFTKQVIAVDLNKVSDIIKPVLWLQICEWLPPRMQLKRPILLFSTNKDGFNLKTLYQLCEDEEQTLIILRTTNDETIGAYLSTSLSERINGHQNLSYFGTGETFIFGLTPMPVCYLWNKGADIGGQHGQKNKYVFVDTAPISFETSGRRFSRRRSSARKSIMRRLSRRLSKQTLRSISVPHPDDFSHLEPLSAINLISKNSVTVPSNLSDGDKKKRLQRHHSLPTKTPVAMQISIQSSPTPMQTKHSHENVTCNSSHKDLPDNATRLQSADLDTKESFHVVEKHVGFHTENVDPTFFIGSKQSGLDGEDEIFVDDDHPLEPPASLFISCDNSTFVVGGGGGQGLYFDGDLQIGRSSRCDTYHNDPLTCEESGDFTIVRLDVFGFQ